LPRQENVLKPGTGKKGKREELLIKEKKEKRKKRLAALDTTHSSAAVLCRYANATGWRKRQRTAALQDLAEYLVGSWRASTSNERLLFPERSRLGSRRYGGNIPMRPPPF
jgi:hypothetical protein